MLRARFLRIFMVLAVVAGCSQMLQSAPPGGPHKVLLSWAASFSPNVAGYNVYRSIRTRGPFVRLNHDLVPGTTYTDSSVQPGRRYYYRVKAVNDTGVESASSTAAVANVPSP
jgi:fibronectin type 3 domain-containing protein